MKLSKLLFESAAEKPMQTAIIADDIKLTYHKLAQDVDRLAYSLIRLASGGPCAVAIALDDGPEYITSFFAVSRAGCVILPLSAKMTPKELEQLLLQADASILITTLRCYDNIKSLSELTSKLNIICVEYRCSELLIASVQSTKSAVNFGNSGLAMLVPTSGSTSNPKLVMHSADAVIANMLSYCRAMQFTKPHRAYLTLAFNHIYCICAQILTHIYRGDTLVLNGKPFFVKDFLSAVQTHKITISSLVPYMAAMIANTEDAAQYDLNSLEMMTVSGAKTPAATLNKLKQKFGNIRFVSMYGMSEAGSRISLTSPGDGDWPAESVGKPIDCMNVRISADSEIEIKGMGIMRGYYKLEEITAKSFNDGWFKTGDTGKIDENGYLYITGRKNNLINSGSYKINPDEVEDVLLSHPDVAEASVVGQKHQLLEEVPVAFIVRKNAELTTENLIRHCRKNLSQYKMPYWVIFTDAIPRNNNHKVDKVRLKEMADKLS